MSGTTKNNRSALQRIGTKENFITVIEYLRANDVQVLGEPTVMTAGPSAGETWVYFLTPWGMQLELVSYPDGKAYEKDYPGKLWYSGNPAE